MTPRPEDDGRPESRFDWMTRRAQVVLAIVGTLVAIATGMIALGNRVFPDHTNNAQASSVPEYQLKVGAICSSINRHDQDRSRETAAMSRRLKRARTTRAQRDALMTSTQRTMRNARDDLTQLAALPAPDQLVAIATRTTRTWQRNLDRVEEYVHRLDEAGTRPQLYAAVRRLASARAPIQRDLMTIRTGLRSLGGIQCGLDPERVAKVVTLPALAHDTPTGSVGAPAAKPLPPSLAAPTPRSSSTAPPAAAPPSSDVGPPAAGGGAPDAP